MYVWLDELVGGDDRRARQREAVFVCGHDSAVECSAIYVGGGRGGQLGREIVADTASGFGLLEPLRVSINVGFRSLVHPLSHGFLLVYSIARCLGVPIHRYGALRGGCLRICSMRGLLEMNEYNSFRLLTTCQVKV